MPTDHTQVLARHKPHNSADAIASAGKPGGGWAGRPRASTTADEVAHEVSLHRYSTEEQPAGGDDVAAAVTPERDVEIKRRRFSPLASGPARAAAAAAAALGGGAGAGGRAAAAPPAPDPDHFLRDALERYGAELVRLQPKVAVDGRLLAAGLCLYRAVRARQVAACRRGAFPAALLACDRLVALDLAACLWVALKHSSVRTAVPNRTLMARAAGAEPRALAARELGALEGLGWGVHAALRAEGLAG